MRNRVRALLLGIAALGALVTGSAADEDPFLSAAPAQYAGLFADDGVTIRLCPHERKMTGTMIFDDKTLPVEGRIGEEGRSKDERQHEVTLTNPYCMQTTEAEWQRAARAGTRTRFSFGDRDRDLPRYGNSSHKSYPNRPSHRDLDDGHAFTAPVGSYPPSPWGLYDVHGNVWEWVQDWYGSYPTGRVRDPTGPSTGQWRVKRGGGYCHDASTERPAERSSTTPSARSDMIGFRLVSPITP